MLAKLKEMKKNKKGFTLVELIVVLVILAILAALLIPALTGYIDKAKQKSVIAETRQCVMAAQTLVDEGSVNTAEGDYGTIKKAKDITNLAEVPGEIASVNDPDLKIEDGKVTQLVYTAKNGKKCTYTYNVKTKKTDYKVE